MQDYLYKIRIAVEGEQAIKAAKQQMASLERQYQNLQRMMLSAGTKGGGGLWLPPGYKAQVDAFRKSQEALAKAMRTGISYGGGAYKYTEEIRKNLIREFEQAQMVSKSAHRRLALAQTKLGKIDKKADEAINAAVGLQTRIYEAIGKTRDQVKAAALGKIGLQPMVGAGGVGIGSGGRGDLSVYDRFVQRFGRLFQYLTSGMVLYGVYNYFRNLSREVMEADESFAKLSAALVGTGTNMTSLETKVYNLATAFGVSVKEVADLATEFARTGLFGKALEEYTKLGLLAEIVTGTQPEMFIKGITAAVQSFGQVGKVTEVMGEEGPVYIKDLSKGYNDLAENTDFARKVLDSWVAVSHEARISMQDLIEGLQTAGASAEEAGLNFDEYNAMMGTVAQSTGMAGRMVGRYLAYAFAGVQGTAAQKALATIGISVKDASGNFKTFAEIIEELHQKWESLIPSQREFIAQSIAGKWRFAPFVALMDNYNTYLKMTALSQNSFGRAMRENQTIQQAFTRQITRLKEGIVGLASSFRYLVYPIMVVAGTIGKLVSWITALSNKVGALGVVGKVLKGIMLALAGVGVYKGLQFLAKMPAIEKLLVGGIGVKESTLAKFVETPLLFSKKVKIGEQYKLFGEEALIPSVMRGVTRMDTNAVAKNLAQKFTGTFQKVTEGGLIQAAKRGFSGFVQVAQGALSGLLTWISNNWIMVVAMILTAGIMAEISHIQDIRKARREAYESATKGAEQYFSRVENLNTKIQTQKDYIASLKKEMNEYGATADKVEKLNSAQESLNNLLSDQNKLMTEIAQKAPAFIIGLGATGEPIVDPELIERFKEIKKRADESGESVSEYGKDLQNTFKNVKDYVNLSGKAVNELVLAMGGLKKPQDLIQKNIVGQLELLNSLGMSSKEIGKIISKAYIGQVVNVLNVLREAKIIDDKTYKRLYVQLLNKYPAFMEDAKKKTTDLAQSWADVAFQIGKTQAESEEFRQSLSGAVEASKSFGFSYLSKIGFTQPQIGMFAVGMSRLAEGIVQSNKESLETGMKNLTQAETQYSAAVEKYNKARKSGNEKMIKEALAELQVAQQNLNGAMTELLNLYQQSEQALEMQANAFAQLQLFLQGINFPLAKLSDVIGLVRQYSPGNIGALREKFAPGLINALQNVLGKAKETGMISPYLSSISEIMGLLTSLGESTTQAASQGMSEAEKASTKFNAARTMLDHFKTMERITLSQYLEGLRYLYSVAPTPEDRLKIEEDIYNTEKEINNQRFQYAQAYIQHLKALDKITDNTRLSYLRQLYGLATTREQKWQIEEEIYSLEKEIQENRVSKAEAWAKHQQAIGRLSEEGLLEIYKEILNTMGSKVPEDVRWRIEEEIYRLENEAKQQTETIERSIFKRAAGLLAPFRISYKEYKKLFGEGEAGEPATGAKMLQEFRQYMTEAVQPVANLNQEVQNMIASEVNAQVSTQTVIAEMQNYAGQVLALAQAQQQATRATNMFSGVTNDAIQKIIELTIQENGTIDATTRLVQALGGKGGLIDKFYEIGTIADNISKIEFPKFPEGGIPWWPIGNIPVHAHARVAGSSTSPAQGLGASLLAQSQLGKPYKRGGSDPNYGFDCSGLVYWAYAQVGKRIPRTTYSWRDLSIALNAYTNPEDWAWLTKVPGALLFVKDWTHMAMATGLPGNKAVIESGRGGVHYSSLSKERWPWVAWPLKKGGEIRGDNVPALLHDREVVLNSEIVKKIDRFFSGASINYVNNSTYNINGTNLNEEQLRRVLEQYEKESAERFSRQMRRYI